MLATTACQITVMSNQLTAADYFSVVQVIDQFQLQIQIIQTTYNAAES